MKRPIMYFITLVFSVTSLFIKLEFGYAEPFAYVGNSGRVFTSASVSVVDTARVAERIRTAPRTFIPRIGEDVVVVTDAVIDTVDFGHPGGGSGGSIVITPDGAFAYVASGSEIGDVINVIEIASNRAVARIPVEFGFQAMAVRPDGHFLYATTPTPDLIGFLILAIDTATHTVVDTIRVPGGLISRRLAVTPDSRFIYVTGQSLKPFGPAVFVIDTVTNTLVTIIPSKTPCCLPEGIVITPNGTRAYVAVITQIEVVDIAQNRIVAVIPGFGGSETGLVTGVGVSDLAITPDGAFIYAYDGRTGEIHVIDTATNTVVTSITVPFFGFFGQLTLPSGPPIVTPDGEFVYFPLASHMDPSDFFRSPGHVLVIDTATNTIVATISDVNLDLPGGIAMTPIVRPLNQPPVANAGPDQAVDEGTVVTLDGSASSDPDGDPLTFSWTQTAGPSVSLSDPTFVMPTFTAPEVAADTLLTFQLIVNDGQVNSAPDTVNITVRNVPTPAEATTSLAQVVQGLGLPAGTTTSLNSTLNAAVNSLNLGNTIAAENQLNAFINQVQAQSGKKLTVEEANVLIAAAQAILAGF